VCVAVHGAQRRGTAEAKCHRGLTEQALPRGGGGVEKRKGTQLIGVNGGGHHQVDKKNSQG